LQGSLLSFPISHTFAKSLHMVPSAVQVVKVSLDPSQSGAKSEAVVVESAPLVTKPEVITNKSSPANASPKPERPASQTPATQETKRPVSAMVSNFEPSNGHKNGVMKTSTESTDSSSTQTSQVGNIPAPSKPVR